LNGRVPRYHRIAETLREQIRAGDLAPGAPLPNQRKLAQTFGVTLMTLRQALELLEREHLIVRRHGLGTFVAAPSIDYDILQLRRFAGDLLALGEPVTTRLIGTRFAIADRHVARALGLAGRARVLVIERLRLVGGRPMGLQHSFLVARLGEELLKSDLERTPLSQALEFKLGITITRAQETVSAVRLGRREARDLDCRAGVPAFESERVSFDTEGRPAVFDRVFIPGDRFRITRELHYDKAVNEERHGFPGVLRASGGLGAISGPPSHRSVQ
jgi:DNA-binding GntR family transcriptional regulator